MSADETVGSPLMSPAYILTLTDFWYLLLFDLLLGEMKKKKFLSSTIVNILQYLFYLYIYVHIYYFLESFENELQRLIFRSYTFQYLEPKNKETCPT